MTAKLNTPLNGTALRLQSAPNLPSVEEHVGLMGRIAARRAVAKEATRALTVSGTAVPPRKFFADERHSPCI